MALFDGPRLSFGQELAKVGDFASACGYILRRDGIIERRAWVVIQHAKRHRERTKWHFHKHVRQRTIGDVVHKNA